MKVFYILIVFFMGCASEEIVKDLKEENLNTTNKSSEIEKQSSQKTYTVINGKNYELISDNKNAFIIKENEKYGLITPDGKILLKSEYDNIIYLSTDIFRIEIKEKVGLYIFNLFLSKIEYDNVEYIENYIYTTIENKMGLLNNEGKKLLDCEYEKIQNINNFLFIVTKDNELGLVDQTGKKILSNSYDSIDLIENNLIKVGMNGLYGLFSTTGEEILKIEYEFIFIQPSGNIVISKNGKSELLNSNGKIISKKKFDTIGEFYDDFVYFKEENKYGLLDKEGNIFLKAIFSYPIYVSKLNESIYILKLDTEDNYSREGNQNLQFGLVDKNGNILLNPNYNELYFEENKDNKILFREERNDKSKVGMINLLNNSIIPPYYDEIQSLYKDTYKLINYETRYVYGRDEEFHSIKIADISKNPVKYIGDTTFSMIIPVLDNYFYVCQDSGCGIMNLDGKYLLDPKYSNIKFSIKNLDIFAVQKNEKWGFVNTEGSYIVYPRFDDVRSFSDKKIPVSYNEKWGCINKKGEVTLRLKYSEVGKESNQYYEVSYDSKWGVADSTGKEIIEVKNEKVALDELEKIVIVENTENFSLYSLESGQFIKEDLDYLESFHGGTAVYGEKINNNTLYGLISSNGKFIVKAFYENLEYLENGIYLYKQNDMFGLLSDKGNKITQAIYSGINKLDDNYYSVSIEDKFGIINKDAKVLLKLDYEKIVISNDNLLYLKKFNDEKCYILDRNLKIQDKECNFNNEKNEDSKVPDNSFFDSTIIYGR